MEKVKASPQQTENLRMSYEDFLAWADEDVGNIEVKAFIRF